MKKILWLHAVFLGLSVLLALGSARPAWAEEAADLTAHCKIQAAPGKYKLTRLYDRDWGTTYVSDKQRSPYVELTASAGEPIYGLYVCFGDKVIPWQVQVKQNGDWATVYESENLFAHVYVPLDGAEQVRVRPSTTSQTVLTIGEIFAFGPGEVPAYVQQWQPAPEKADLLVLAGHPDDEILFFGGAIPYYAGEKGMNVVVAYMTCNTMERRSELLNGLWEMGVRTYPDIGDFWDKYSKKLDSCYEAWGKTKTYERIVELYRRYKPEVVLTHDAGGEYGHGAHRVCADAALHCVAAAADESKYAASAQTYGVWAVKKVYLHLGKEQPIEMDWDQPLSALGGRTGYEVAVDAYQWHVSQHEAGQKNPDTGKFEVFVVEPRDSKYSCYRFGLAYTAVGPDEAGNDFFEHIP